jgi:thioredoxin 1
VKQFAVLLVAALICLWLVLSSHWRSQAMNQSTANIRHLAPTEFDAEVLRATNLVVVDFYATWCGTCRLLAPMLERAASNNVPAMKFVKINYDEAPELASKFSVTGLPTVIFFRDSKEAGRYAEVPDEVVLHAKLAAFAEGK